MKAFEHRQSATGHTLQAAKHMACEYLISSNSQTTTATPCGGEKEVADESRRKRRPPSRSRLTTTKGKPFHSGVNWLLSVNRPAVHPELNLLTVNDAYSKVIFACAPVGSVSALIELLSELVSKHGRPDRIICDRHRYFASSRLAGWAAKANIQICYPSRFTDLRMIGSLERNHSRHA
jgi:hypothetical protein